jgi:predicted aldo/keto reductase-like oxidoreductase
MTKNYLGSNIPKLGFGLMRLPSLTNDPMHGEIDLEQVKAMVDLFMKQGFTYFDTAYVYGNGKSEMAIREALVKRYPRESFQLADKLPVWKGNSYEELRPIFNTSLERAGVDYFDFYLLHSLDREGYQQSLKTDAWKFQQELKAAGLIKHAGFSFHDTADILEEILTAHPEVEFVQLQINYADWDSEETQSRLNYETARRHNIPVIIMEPVKGGFLADMNAEIQSIMKTAHPDQSLAAWAIRFAASLEGVITVLSGMSSLAQLVDNTSTMVGFKPLDDAERAVLEKVVRILASIPTIPCTSCKYCVEDCPQKINIPMIFRITNDVRTYGNVEGAKIFYGMVTRGGGKASACIQCGACEQRCPQHIEIMKILQEVAPVME